MIKMRKTTLSSIILVILSISGFVIAAGIGNEVEAEDQHFSENITVFEEFIFQMDLPPIVTELIIYSSDSNSEMVNFTLPIWYSDYYIEYDYYLFPGESLSTNTNLTYAREPLVDGFRSGDNFRLLFSNTSSSQEISIEVFGRTETVQEILINPPGWRQMFALVLFAFVLFPSIIALSLSFLGVSIHNISNLVKHFSEYGKIRLLPVISSTFPVFLLLYAFFAGIFSWYFPLFCVFYYIPYLLSCRYVKNRLDEFYFWISLGLTEIFVSIFTFWLYRPDSPIIINEIQVYTTSALLPYQFYLLLIGVITIILSIQFSRYKPFQRDLKISEVEKLVDI
jgi:hypothetical protein